MKMINKKGFVLTETLVVTVFLVTIFTFVYVSIVPLMGKYDDMSYHNSDIDIVYKLYAIRQMINKDSNRDTIVSNTFKVLTKSDFADGNYYDALIDYLELSNYTLVIVDNIHNRLSNFNSLSGDTNKEVYNYIINYEDYTEKVLVLFDKNRHTIAHLVIY